MTESATSAHGAERSPLGKSSPYCDTYQPGLLFPIARQLKRDEIGIGPHRLPFVGEDLWNAYELSWLTPKGKPVVALGEFRVPADSPCLIESKSLKLYLNSFNQTAFDGLAQVAATIEADLSAAAGARVAVSLSDLASAAAQRVIALPPGASIDGQDVSIDTYQPCPDFLQVTAGDEVSEILHSQLLKSNCLVTGQPDWGCVVIRYQGRPIDRAGLLRYVCSFRQHNEFHEQCVERIFGDILNRCQPRSLAVWARYTRRGGLDINPFRATPDSVSPPNVAEVRQ